MGKVIVIMKRVILIFVTLFLIIANLQAQDLIVTTEGDSINCKITKTTKEVTYFTFKHKGEIRNVLLPVNEIVTQQKDYFSHSEVPTEIAVKAVRRVNHSRYRIAADAGYQHRTTKLDNSMDRDMWEHYKKMMSGFHYDLQAAYFIWENYGFELMFSQQRFGNSGYGYIKDDDGNLLGEGELNNMIKFNYYGLNYLTRYQLGVNQKSTWLVTIGAGYLTYDDRWFINQTENLKMTAGNLGINIAIGYDYTLSSEYSVGVKLSLLGGNFSKYAQTVNSETTMKTLPEGTVEGLGTIKISAGLRFIK